MFMWTNNNEAKKSTEEINELDQKRLIEIGIFILKSKVQVMSLTTAKSKVGVEMENKLGKPLKIRNIENSSVVPVQVNGAEWRKPQH